MDRAVFRGRQARAAGVLSSMFLLWFPLYLALSVFVVLLLVKIYSLVSVGRCTCRRSMSGKTVIITGANSGVGKETARELCRRGARVILACRDVDKARLAASDIAGETGVQPLCMQLDLCSFESVRHFAQQVLEREQRLDVLINNAGALPPPERRETEDGFEVTFQANHLGHFLLTNLLLGLLKKTAPSRIINVGSTAHWFGRFEVDNIGFKRYIQNRIYCNTKLYNMLFTVELAQRLAGTGVTANCCHPGFVKSHLADRTGDFHARLVDFLVHMFGKSVRDGAQTSVHLAVSGEVRGESGKMFADCKPSWAVPRWATNPRHAELLWEVSHSMAGLSS